MRFVLEVNLDSADFTIVSNDEHNGEPNPGPELARILTRVRMLVRDGETSGTVRDTNGGTVGSWVIR